MRNCPLPIHNLSAYIPKDQNKLSNTPKKYIILTGVNECLDSHVQDAYAAQLRLFLGEVREQSQLLALRSHLTLHSTVTIAKLAQYINATEATVRYSFLMQVPAVPQRMYL